MLHLTKDANTGPVRENSLLFEDETILLLGLFLICLELVRMNKSLRYAFLLYPSSSPRL